MSVEILYRVVHLVLSRGHSSMKMVLEEVRTVPPEEIERARLEADQEPEVDVVEEGELLQKIDFNPKPKTQMEEVFSAMRTQFPEFAEAVKSMSFPRVKGEGMTMRVVPISQLVEVSLTHEQYKKLESPSLWSIIKVSMKLEVKE